MKVIGIVAEWNPFHLGHSALVQEIRSKQEAAIIVSVMSGSFCQRGEAAIFDKWIRAEMALANGVDVVIELPQYAATASLEQFATVGVEALCAFHPLDALYCGSETGEAAAITEQASYLKNNKRIYEAFINEALANGTSYTQASQDFLYQGGFNTNNRSTPNDRLALQYRLALPDTIPLHCFKRTVAHDNLHSHNKTASASMIRQALYNNDSTYEQFLPIETCQRLPSKVSLPQHEDLLWPLKVYAASHSPQSLADSYGIHDGWENRFHASICEATSYEALLTLAQTKHYSRSRIRRLILSILSPIHAASSEIPYLRILGASQRGRCLLKGASHKAPLILNVAKALPLLSENGKQHLQDDIHRQNLFDLLCHQPITNRDFLEKPRIQSH